MTSEFILELEEGASVVIEADTLEEAKKKLAEKFEKTVQDSSTGKRRHGKSDIQKSLYNHILRLKDEGFFSEPRTLNDIRQKLKELAVHYPVTTFPSYLNKLIQGRVLRRFQETKRGKKFWVYVNG